MLQIVQHLFNSPLPGTTRVSRYQKGKTNQDLLGHLQICTLSQTDNHTGTPPLSFYRADALFATQPTVTKH